MDEQQLAVDDQQLAGRDDAVKEVVDEAVFEQKDETPEDVPSADETLRYFGADFDVDGIVRRLASGNLIVPSFNPPPTEGADYAGFQRGFVWTKSQKDRFIESLLLGYPVPGVFLVERPRREYLILDGQQRIKTLHDFVTGIDSIAKKPFRLRYVSASAPYYNKSFGELSDADRNLLNNTFIQATVVIPRDRAKLQGVYQLFERINSGGTNLQPQEIRVALYAGSRVDTLREMNDSESWRALFGRPHSRLKDTELILRYLALRPVALLARVLEWDREAIRTYADANSNLTKLEKQGIYKAPMGQFLNSYLEAVGEDAGREQESVDAFYQASTLLAQFGRDALKMDDSPQINAAHADAILVGLSLNPKLSEVAPSESVRDNIGLILNELRGNEEYSKSVRESTSHTSSIYSRLEIATKAFEKLA